MTALTLEPKAKRNNPVSIVFKNVRALSFDLDDTLYDNKPVIRKAYLALYHYLLDHYPDIAINYNLDAFLRVAQQLREKNTSLDINQMRRVHIQHVINDCGYKIDAGSNFTENAFQVFWRARWPVRAGGPRS